MLYLKLKLSIFGNGRLAANESLCLLSSELIYGGYLCAGAVGIEPTQLVLETSVLPLYDAPN